MWSEYGHQGRSAVGADSVASELVFFPSRHCPGQGCFNEDCAVAGGWVNSLCYSGVTDDSGLPCWFQVRGPWDRK